MPRLFLSAFLAVGAAFQPVVAEELLAYCSISSHQFRHAPTSLSRCVVAQSKDDIDIRLSDGSHLVFPSDEQGISHMRLVTPDGLALTIVNDRTVNVLWLFWATSDDVGYELSSWLSSANISAFLAPSLRKDVSSMGLIVSFLD